MPTISAIIPAFNAEQTIKSTITSILQQSYTDFELIIVNDGSNDNTIEICKSFLDSRIKIINQINGGLSCARNSGIQASIGKYICFIDSDDTIEYNYLDKLYTSIINSNSDLAICGMQLSSLNNTSFLCFNQDKSYQQIWENEEFLSYFQKGLLNSACNKLYKTNIIKKNNIIFPSQTLTEDIAFNIDYFKHSTNISTIKEALYIYQLQNSQLTKKVSEDMFINYFNVHTNLLSTISSDKHRLIHQFVYHQYVSIIMRYLYLIKNKTLNKKDTFTLLDKYIKTPLIKKAFDSYHPVNYKEYIIYSLIKFKCYSAILLYLNK